MNQAPVNKNQQDKFLLVLNLPAALRDINDGVTRNNNRIDVNSLEYSVKGTVTPAIRVPELTLPYASQSIKVSSHARQPVDPLKIDFRVDSEWKNYWVIYKWLDLLNDASQGFFDADGLRDTKQMLPEYSSTMSLFGLDEYNNKKIRFDYDGVFPTELSEITWDYRNPDAIDAAATFQFTQLRAELV